MWEVRIDLLKVYITYCTLLLLRADHNICGCGSIHFSKNTADSLAPLFHPAIFRALPGHRPRVDWCLLIINLVMCLLQGRPRKGIEFKNKLIFKLDLLEPIGYFSKLIGEETVSFLTVDSHPTGSLIGASSLAT